MKHIFLILILIIISSCVEIPQIKNTPQIPDEEKEDTNNIPTYEIAPPLPPVENIDDLDNGDEIEEESEENNEEPQEQEPIVILQPQVQILPLNTNIPQEEIKIVSLFNYLSSKSNHSFNFSNLYFTYESNSNNCYIAGNKYIAFASRDITFKEYIHICKPTWDTYPNIYKEMVLFHELAHIFLDLDHTNGKDPDTQIYLSLMNSFLFGEKIYKNNYQYYIEELFKYSFPESYSYGNFQYLP